MNKTYKKSDISKLKNESTTIEEDEINELINSDGTMIDRDDNFKANTRIVRSKKTTDDFIRGATQGPEAYFIYGGPYYGINYSYKVNEEKTLTEEDTDLYSEQEMKNMVDEIIHNKKSSRGMVKRSNEQDVMGGLEQPIPDISELKQVHQKPMVIRKMNLFLDLTTFILVPCRHI